MLPLVKLCEGKVKDFRQKNMFENIDEEFLSILYDSQKEIKETDEKKMR
jgi:hypothetical protein